MPSFRPMARLLGLAAIFAVIAPGCDTTPPPPDMTGTVTFEGEEVAEGQIYIIPNKAKGNEGKSINASIANGRYEIRAKDRPVPRGQVIFKVDALIEGGIYSYKTEVELPEGQSTRDFAVKKADTTYIPPLAAPGVPGGGGGKAKKDNGDGPKRGKRSRGDKDGKKDDGAKKSDSTTKKDEPAPDKDKDGDQKPKDEKPKDDKPKDDKPVDKKNGSS